MANSSSLSERSSAMAILSRQGAVLGALILRDMHTRFGRDNVGYLWMIAEPMLLASVVSSLHFFTDTHFRSGMGPFPFSLVGYCLFIIFRGIFNRAETVVESSVGLLHHKMIRPLDLLTVRSVVECLGCISALIILMTIGIILGIAELPARPLYLMFGAFLITWWSFALSLIVAAYTYDNHTLGRFVHPISYFMVPMSGAFWTMSVLPVEAQPYMAWNPMLTMFEIARYGQFRWADSEYMYPGYAIAVCAGLTYWGLIVIRRLSDKINVA